MSGEAIIPYQPNTACLLVKAELACWNPEPKYLAIYVGRPEKNFCSLLEEVVYLGPFLSSLDRWISLCLLNPGK